MSFVHLDIDHIYPFALVSFLKNPRDPVEEGAKGFAIVQAKPTLYPILSDAIPQAVLEVAAFAKKQK